MSEGTGEEEMINLISGDGVTTAVTKGALLQSKMLKELIDVAGNQDITLDFIHSNDLALIVEYLNYHYKTSKEETKPKNPEDVDEKDKEFVKRATVGNKSHLRFLANTDKLGLPDFFELLGYEFADKIEGKSCEEIRKEWFVTNYTPLTKEHEHIIFETDEWLYPEDPEAKKDAVAPTEGG
jgi:hypothetical protein